MNKPHHRLGAMIAVAAIMCAWPMSAHAACSSSVRSDSLATQRLLAALQQRAAAGSTDAAALYGRARSHCNDIRPVRAIVMATDQYGVPSLGRRVRVLGIDLIGLAQPDGSVAWRLDLARVAIRPTLAALDAASFGTVAVTWSADPTQLTWDPGQQSAVVAILGRSPQPDLRARAARGIRAFGVGTRATATSRLPLLQQLTIATRISVDAGSQPPVVDSVSRSIALRTYARVRGTHQRAWSRIDGEWSTLRQHRALITGTSTLLKRYPHTRTKTVVDALRSTLTSKPTVTFRTLPTAPFYPWPRDGAFDSQRVIVNIDKPATVTLLVYDTDGTQLRSITARNAPGIVTRSWDGARSDGTTADTGAYRYNVDARDLAGNHIRIPGLNEFTIARDTTPPAVLSTSMRVVGTGASRRAIVAWSLNEPLSPIVSSWLVMTRGSSHESIRLHDSLQRATVRRALALEAGDWKAVVVFIDGSGNRTQQGLGVFHLR